MIRNYIGSDESGVRVSSDGEGETYRSACMSEAWLRAPTVKEED